MRCLIALLSFFAVFSPLFAPRSPGSVIAIDPNNSDRVEGRFKTPLLDAQETIERLQDALSQSANKAVTLEDSLAELRSKQADMLARNKQLEEQKDGLERASSTSTARIKELEAIETQLREQAARSATAGDELVTLKAKLASTEQELSAAQKEVKDLQGSTARVIAPKDAEILALTVELTQLRERAKTQEDLAARLATTEKALTVATAEDEAADEERETKIELLEEYTEKLATLEREKKEAEARIKDLEVSLEEKEALQKKHAELVEIYSQLKEAYDQVPRKKADDVRRREEHNAYVAHAQWTALLNHITEMVLPHLEEFSQITANADAVKKLIDKVVDDGKKSAAGRTAALDMNKILRSEKAELEKQLTKLTAFDTQVKELESQKAMLSEQVKQLTTGSKEKDEKISTLVAQVQDLQSQIASSAAAMEELQSSQIAPAAQLRAQLVALKQLMGSLISKMQRLLATLGEKTTPLVEYIEEAKENEKKLRDFSRSLKTFEDNVREFIDLSKKVSSLRRSSRAGESDRSPAELEKVRRLEDQLASVTSEYNQLAREANDRVETLQAQVFEMRSRKEDSSVKEEMARLQRQMEAERERRETDERISRQIADASLREKIATNETRALRDELNAQRERSTDIATGQAFAASMAASAASKTAAPGSSPVVVTLSGLQSDLGRYGAAPTQQFINGMPSSYQPYMTSISRMPQFGQFNSMGQVTTVANKLTEGRRTYIETYKRTITFLRSPASRTSTEGFNSLEATLFNAVSREGYIWYSRGLNSTNKATAITQLTALRDEVARPMGALKQELESQGIAGYRQPEDLVAKFSNFIRLLGGAA